MINAPGAVPAQYWYIPVESIVVDPRFNNRYGAYTVEDISDLLEDLDNGKGIESPVICRPLPDNRPLLVEGYRRYSATKYWNETHKPSQAVKLPVIVKSMNDEEAMEANIAENVKRKSLSPMDQAMGIRTLTNAGKNDIEIARIYRKSKSWVVQIRKLLTLERRIQQMVHTDIIPSASAIELAEMTSEERGIVIVAIENNCRSKFTKSNIRAAGREIGAFGSGQQVKQPETDLPAHTAKRKQRTTRELNDYWDKWEMNDLLSRDGQKFAMAQLDLISGKLSDAEMDNLMTAIFRPAINNENKV